MIRGSVLAAILLAVFGYLIELIDQIRWNTLHRPTGLVLAAANGGSMATGLDALDCRFGLEWPPLQFPSPTQRIVQPRKRRARPSGCLERGYKRRP